MITSILFLQENIQSENSVQYQDGRRVKRGEQVKIIIVVIKLVIYLANTIRKLHRYHDFCCSSICLSVTDVGVAITNLRVMCKIIMCVQLYRNGQNLF